MGIQPVPNNSNSFYMPSNSNNFIKQLEKAKSQLQDQITKINEGKLDDKTKQERIKMLQDHITQIEEEIQAKKSEKANESQKKDGQNSANQTDKTNNKYDGSLEVMTGLIEAKATYSKAQIMNGIKNHLHSDSRILKKEIEVDESRSISGSKAVVKRQELEEIEAREKVLNKKVASTNEDIQNQVQEASRVASEKEDKNIKTNEESYESITKSSLGQNIRIAGSSGEEKNNQ